MQQGSFSLPTSAGLSTFGNNSYIGQYGGQSVIDPNLLAASGGNPIASFGSGQTAPVASSGISSLFNNKIISSTLGNLGTAANIAGGLAGTYLGFKQLGLAKKNFNFQKQAYNTNLQNTVKAHNTSLEDRFRTRAFAQGDTAGTAERNLARHSLSAPTI